MGKIILDTYSRILTRLMTNYDFYQKRVAEEPKQNDRK